MNSSSGIERGRLGSGPLTSGIVVDGPTLRPETATAVREAWGALWTSRLVVWGAALLGVMWFGAVPAGGLDSKGLTTPFPPFGDLLAAPVARWDSVWYLTIAGDGYGGAGDHARAAFYPLYPLLIHVGNWILGSQLIVGGLISLACFFAALVLLYRLAELDLGARDARGTLLLVAFFPAAFYLSAIYSEALFLALSVGAILAARQGRWAWAGVAGGLAALTRNSGLLLLVPLALLFLYGPRADRDEPPDAAAAPRWRPRHPLTPQALWLALVPLGLAVYVGYCALHYGDALAPFHAQRLWFRHFQLLGGVSGGVSSAWHELHELLHAKGPVAFTGGDTGPLHVAGMQILLLGFLVATLVALAGVLRRLPFAYGAYVSVVLLATLCYPTQSQPLESLPRLVAVLFPLQMWAARWLGERGRLERAVGVSAVLLGVMAIQFARWGFVG